MGQDREGDTGTGLQRIDWMAAAKQADAETDAQMARATWPAAGEPLANPAHWSAPADSSGAVRAPAGHDFERMADSLLARDPIAQEAIKARAMDYPTVSDVTGCGDCPFRGEDGPYNESWDVCEHPSAPDDCAVYMHLSGPAPDFCPLRAAPLLVRLRVGP